MFCIVGVAGGILIDRRDFGLSRTVERGGGGIVMRRGDQTSPFSGTAPVSGK